MGTSLNKTLKDFVVRYKNMQGFRSPYVPGWDCHGLPVEHRLLKEMNKTKHDVELLEFRRKAKEYALKWVGIQREEFKRLGVLGRWERPYLTIDPEAKRLDWLRAGHDPALVYDPVGDEFAELKGNGLALGVNEGFDYEENHRSGLANGQIVAVGTDGIWEAVNRDGEMFGKARLRRIIRQHAGAQAGDILSAVYDELNQFTRGQKTEDDITLVIIKVQGL